MNLDDVFRLLEKATLLEKDGQRIEASTKYYEGCHLMRQVVSGFPQGDKDPVAVLLRERIQCYTLHAQKLYFDEGSVNVNPTTSIITNSTAPIQQLPRRPATITLGSRTADDVSVLTFPGNQSSVYTEMHRKIGLGNARLERAIHLEEENKNYNNSNGNNDNDNDNNRSNNTKWETTIQSYLSAAEVYLSAVNLSEESSLPLPQDVKRRLVACLDRIEALKHQLAARKKSSPTTDDEGIT